MKTIKYFFESIFIFISFILMKIMGISVSRKIFSFIFKTLGPIFRKNKIIDENLAKYKNSIPLNQKENIKSNMWSNYGMVFVEYIFLKRFRENKEHISISGEENLNKVLNKRKPVIFVSGHFANFELMSMEITKRDIKLATIYRPLNNFFINPLMEYLRKKYICNNQIKKGINGVRDAIIFLKRGYSIALMIDQRVSEGEKIDFFGFPALTTTLPAQLAIKYNLSIIPVFIERYEEKNFKLEFLKEINTSDFKDKLELTKKLNNVLEKMISKNPNQWIWTHNRWK